MALPSFDLYAVGGSVRDEILGLDNKDHDFTAVCNKEYPLFVQQAFALLARELKEAGYLIFIEKPKYATIRARFPKGHQHEKMVADFVLARKEGPYSDGRRPDYVKLGSLHDDLARRDFTMNAIAKTENGEFIDPFGGRMAINDGLITCVGKAEYRFREDALRGLRALRFSITKNFSLSAGIRNALTESWFIEALESVSAERKREELSKMFRHNVVESMALLTSFGYDLAQAIFKDGLWLMPTLKE